MLAAPHTRSRKHLLAAWLAILIFIGPLISSSASASEVGRITVTGLIGCDQGPFVGVWVVSSGGGSGWAHWSDRGSSSIAHYNRTFTTSLPTTLTLHIGCTGSAKRWGVAMSSPSVSTDRSTDMNDWCNPGSASCGPLTPPAYGGWTTDWAGPTFCHSSPARVGAAFSGTVLAGVATCGTGWEGPNGNYQGWVGYDGHMFDSYGYQCVEYVERYFYYLTGQLAPIPKDGDASYFAYTTQRAYPRYAISAGGGNGGSDIFDPNTIIPGTIMSMWSESDLVGHVGVVSNVQVSNGNGTISLADENASPTGTDTISVQGGRMTMGHYDQFQWISGLPDPRFYSTTEH